MKMIVAILSLFVAAPAFTQAKPDEQSGTVNRAAAPDNLKVVLLGTGVGPRINLQQFGAAP